MSAQVELCDLEQNPPPWISYPESIQLFAALKKAGGNARFVGGCVRDALLGAVVEDLDVCTDLQPLNVLNILEGEGIRVIPTGLKHGTVTALLGEKKFEITTLRKDVKTYGRHADVFYTTDWKEDAARRDFTINALSMDQTGTLYDYFSGQKDLAAGHVKFIGSAEKRIQEDRLRVLRFFRFFSRYGKGEPNRQAVDACRKAANDLNILSAERVSKELFLLLGHSAPLRSMQLMLEADVLPALLKKKGTLTLLEGMLSLPVPSQPINRLGALLMGDLAWAKKIASDLRLSRNTAVRLKFMCESSLPMNLSIDDQKTYLYRMGQEMFKDQVLLMWAKDQSKKQYKMYLDLADTWQIPCFPVGGRDLLDRGLTVGPKIGNTLNHLEEQWIDSRFSLTKEKLLKLL